MGRSYHSRTSRKRQKTEPQNVYIPVQSYLFAFLSAVKDSTIAWVIVSLMTQKDAVADKVTEVT